MVIRASHPSPAAILPAETYWIEVEIDSELVRND